MLHGIFLSVFPRLRQGATCATFIAMSRIINQRELRNQSAAVLREVEAGETIVVTRNGTPVAELRPIRARRFVPRATLSEGATRAPRIDARRFRADIDAVVDQRLDD
jgi:prevent-host-death family protein